MKMGLQEQFDAWSNQWREERQSTQMTLGKLISSLEALPGWDYISAFGEPHSYRGYYTDLAFEPTDEKMLISDALRMCKDTLGQTFEGYKGGDFHMDENAPVWIAHYGCCGEKLMAILPDGTLETKYDD